mgnify:CR=1 FL=1
MAYTISAINLKGADTMANTTNFSVRMDSDIKKQCETLYNELGVNLTTAINVFLRQSLRAGGFPFEVRLEQPTGDWVGHRECHIQPDWLLIYRSCMVMI